MLNVSTATHELLGRPCVEQVHFSDVFPDVVPADGTSWWRHTDFDAGLTVMFESGAVMPSLQIPIGSRPWLAQYGLVLLDDLVTARQKRVESDASAWRHRDILAEKTAAARATIAVANYAPRDDVHVTDGQNGEDFYLAITKSGLEIYVTPLTFLRGLAERNRIASLYRIPTKGHPEFDGDHEQFRSARVMRTRRHPGHLVPMLATPGEDIHSLIPADPRNGHIAFIDKFGNVKLEEHDIQRLGSFVVGQELGLRIDNAGEIHELPVVVAADFASAPLEQLAVFQNCSDQRDGANVGFVELISRVNGNPSVSDRTAAFQLMKAVPNLDIETAEVKLVY